MPLALLACFVAAVCASVSAVAAEGDASSTPNLNLSSIVVQSEAEREELPGGFIYRRSRDGILGSTDIMDIPFTQFNLTEKSVNDYGDPSLPLNLVLVNDPSIRASVSSPMYSDFSIRGINANGNNVYLNRVPNLFAQFLTPPNHIIGSIDIMSGPNTVLYGSTTSVNGTNGYSAPNGIISIMSKRATVEPITRYTQTFSGRGSLGEYIDLGRRFGTGKEWGVRINAQHLEGDLAVPGMAKKERNVFVNLDHKGEKSETNVLAGYFDIDVTGGQRWFNLSNASTRLVNAPDSGRSFDYDGQEKIQHGYIITLNHDQKLSDDWGLFLNAGMTDRSGYKYDNQGGSLDFNGNTGIISASLLHMVEANKNKYAQFGIQGKIRTGELTNNLSLAYDWSWVKNYRTQTWGPAGSLSGSVFSGVARNGPLPIAGKANPIDFEITKSLTIADHLEYKKFGLIVSFQRRDNQYQSFNATTGQLIERSNHVAISPTFAITFKPLENLLLYASHSEGYTRARSVTGTQYANFGELIDPVKNEQNEIGAKYQFGDMITTLSLFSVDQASFRDEASDGRLYMRSDGKSEYKGVEWNINGKVLPKLNLSGGVLFLDAKRNKTANGTFDGMYVQGVAKWSGILASEFEIGDKNSVLGRIVYTGPSYVTDANKVKIPAWYSVDLGYKHEVEINHVPVKLSVMCFNLFDKDYWVGRAGSNVIGLSMPRTITFSAQVDF
jgi:iron complex outermembrane receptor protein